MPVTRQTSDHSSSSGSPGSWNPSVESVMWKSTTETLTGDETVHELQNNNSPRLSPVVCQLDQPTMVSTPVASTSGSRPKHGKLPQNHGPKPAISRQNSARGHPIPSTSSPSGSGVAVSSSQSSVKTTKKVRSMSDSSACPGPRVPRLHRQSSVVLSSPTWCPNRFAVLARLKEESERLMQEQ